MKKTLKVRKMINQNGLQVDNYTMVIRLKKIIQQLNTKIQHQDQIIIQLKRDTKTTKIYQMEVQIQHLNDENKRLTLMIQQLKSKHKQSKILSNNYLNNNISNNLSYKQWSINTQSDSNNIKTDSKSILVNEKRLTDGMRAHTIKKRKKSPNSMMLFGGMSAYSFNTSQINNYKKTYPEVQKEKEQQFKQQIKQKKFEKKYFQLLQQTQKLKKQLINIKLNQSQSSNKKTKPINLPNYTSDFDKTCNFFIQKNIQSLQRMTQKKNDLQVENDILKGKLLNSEKRMFQLQKENQQIKAILFELQAEIKRKNLLYNQKRTNKKMPTLFMDLSNNSTIYDM